MKYLLLPTVVVTLVIVGAFWGEIRIFSTRYKAEINQAVREENAIHLVAEQNDNFKKSYIDINVKLATIDRKIKKYKKLIAIEDVKPNKNVNTIAMYTNVVEKLLAVQTELLKYKADIKARLDNADGALEIARSKKFLLETLTDVNSVLVDSQDLLGETDNMVAVDNLLDEAIEREETKFEVYQILNAE